LVRIGTKRENYTRCGALRVAPQRQMVQRGTMRFGENHLPASQRKAVTPSGDNEGEELGK
jgi:hypothetical protein